MILSDKLPSRVNWSLRVLLLVIALVALPLSMHRVPAQVTAPAAPAKASETPNIEQRLDRLEKIVETMLEGLSMYSDELMEKLLSEETISEELVHNIVREAVQGQDLTPVFMGTRIPPS